MNCAQKPAAAHIDRPLLARRLGMSFIHKIPEPTESFQIFLLSFLHFDFFLDLFQNGFRVKMTFRVHFSFQTILLSTRLLPAMTDSPGGLHAHYFSLN